MVADSDDAWFAERNPDADWTDTETAYTPPTFEMFEITDDPDCPTLSIYGTVNGPTELTPPPTPPDRLVYASWSDAYDVAFDYEPTGQSGMDSAVLYYWGTSDEDTPITVNPGESASVTAYLHAIAGLEVTITSPADGATFSPCENFTVNATVRNIGAADATDVTATISIDANASLVSGDNPQSLGDIEGGGSATATWTLHCDSGGDSVITVTAAGTDAASGEPITATPDSITVHQQTAPAAAPGGLSGGAIAGIVSGAIVALILGTNFLLSRKP
jgi:hypothetical protein